MLKTQSTSATTNDMPDCFGRSFDRTDTLCVGGHDPAYWDGVSHRRESCKWVPSCSARVQASNPAKPTNIIPAASLVRTPPTTPATPFNKVTQPTQPATTSFTPWRPSTTQQQPQAPAWGAAHYGIPQYLTVREPENGRSLLGRLFVEIWRSLGKSLGHTIAHFFDVEPVGRQPQPQQPPHNGHGN